MDGLEKWLKKGADNYECTPLINMRVPKKEYRDNAQHIAQDLLTCF